MDCFDDHALDRQPAPRRPLRPPVPVGWETLLELVPLALVGLVIALVLGVAAITLG
jgi:hypothetical protein